MQVAAELVERGISAGYYHADMDPWKRQEVHQNWSCNYLQVGRAEATLEELSSLFDSSFCPTVPHWKALPHQKLELYLLGSMFIAPALEF